MLPGLHVRVVSFVRSFSSVLVRRDHDEERKGGEEVVAEVDKKEGEGRNGWVGWMD